MPSSNLRKSSISRLSIDLLVATVFSPTARSIRADSNAAAALASCPDEVVRRNPGAKPRSDPSPSSPGAGGCGPRASPSETPRGVAEAAAQGRRVADPALGPHGRIDAPRRIVAPGRLGRGGAAVMAFESGDKGRDGAGFSSIVISEAAGTRQYVQLVGRGLVGIEAAGGLKGRDDPCPRCKRAPRNR